MNYRKNECFSKVGLSELLMRIIGEVIKGDKNEAVRKGQPHKWKSNEPM